MLERFLSSLFFCVVIFRSVLVQCCSILFCLGCWRAPFSLLSEPFSSFFPSCLSLVTALICFDFLSTFVGLLCNRVFLCFSFIFCGHFSLSSSILSEASSTVSSCHRARRSVSKSRKRSCGFCFAQCATRDESCGRTIRGCLTTTMHLLTTP